MATNVLIGIHGMLVSPKVEPQIQGYESILTDLELAEPSLRDVFPPEQRVFINWAQDLPPAQPRDDQKLRIAENFMVQHIGTKNVKPTAKIGINPIVDALENVTIRVATDMVKDTVFMFGMTDVLYYAGDGEKPVRQNVFASIAAAVLPLARKSSKEVVRLHFFAHSQGATIAHDVLFALFNTVNDDRYFTDTVKPGYGIDQGVVDDIRTLRHMSTVGKIQLGSFNTVGSQISVNLMRSQDLVDKLFKHESIDSTQLGLPPDGPVVWNNFYDRDDVLGYPLRGLYGYPSTIAEYEVQTGLLVDAHTSYWKCQPVIKMAAKLIASRL